MKKVFRIRQRLFYACNGREIRNCHYVEYVGSKVYLSPVDGDRYQIELVKPPPGRCPHCGEKL